jgi:hypothetical protein
MLLADISSRTGLGDGNASATWDSHAAQRIVGPTLQDVVESPPLLTGPGRKGAAGPAQAGRATETGVPNRPPSVQYAAAIEVRRTTQGRGATVFSQLIGLRRFRGRSSEAEHQLPKLRTRVRFSSPALYRNSTAGVKCIRSRRAAGRARTRCLSVPPSTIPSGSAMRQLGRCSPRSRDPRSCAEAASPPRLDRVGARRIGRQGRHKKHRW